jgi:aspartate racemase
VALAFDEAKVSYRELNGRANKIARRLRELGVQHNDLVGVCLERSIHMIVALLGVLKAGAAFVPFDPSYPRERLDFMLADTSAPVMITQKSLVGVAVAGRRVSFLLVDEEAESTSVEDEPNLTGATSATDLAYVMYTSGSTGLPKGVMVEHRSIVRLVMGTNFCRFGPEQVFLQYAPISFDASTLEIWGALLHGSTLVMMPPKACSLEEIGKAVHAHGVTTLWLTAGLFHLFVDERLHDLEDVEQLIAGGEALSANHVRRALKSLPNTVIVNGYGPTEGTTFTCCHVMRPGDPVGDSVPIGRPICNTLVYLLDELMQPVPPGQPGELWAAGDGIARGYLNSPELSAKKFLRDPFCDEPGARMYRTGDLARWRDDGTVEFLGRLDSQVKILGHRIEPGEVEGALNEHESVAQACVVVETDPSGTKRLVAYFVPSGGEVSPATLKHYLSEKLPPYMIPAHFYQLSVLPLNPNGKVDRGALPKLRDQSAEPVKRSTQSQLTETITEIWRDTLNTRHFGLDDNFFDIGGDSLLLVKVHSRLQTQLQTPIDIVDLFEFTTISSLAKHLGDASQHARSLNAIAQQAVKQREAFARHRACRGDIL